MAGSAERQQWLEKVVELLRAREGVAAEDQADGRMALEITYNGVSKTAYLAQKAGDFRTQKIQYGQLRKTLTELGIIEGQTFVAPKRSRKPMSPDMLAARAKRQKEFEAWQEVWRAIRAAEKSLDVEFEIAQMLDYY